jgi:hypothetical protein
MKTAVLLGRSADVLRSLEKSVTVA